VPESGGPGIKSRRQPPGFFKAVCNRSAGSGRRNSFVNKAHQSPGKPEQGGNIPAGVVPQGVGEKGKIGTVYEPVGVNQKKGGEFSHDVIVTEKRKREKLSYIPSSASAFTWVDIWGGRWYILGMAYIIKAGKMFQKIVDYPRIWHGFCSLSLILTIQLISGFFAVILIFSLGHVTGVSAFYG
jgi:hypothetical protein